MICVHCHQPDATESRCHSCQQDPRLEARYCLREVIGTGAKGTLWRALDLQWGHEVAIKERGHLGLLDEEESRRFAREARVLRQLHHPSIPRYVDAFTSGRGRARRSYLVQELVKGQSLLAELEERRYNEREVLAIVEEVAQVLTYLHGLAPPVIHRDIKPGNVMRRLDGTVVLVDFGAAQDTPSETLGPFTVAGTFGFMAPEQYAGEASPASDIYALGALAVALLSRRGPQELMRGGRLAWQKAVVASPATTKLLERMLAPEPNKRPSAGAVGQEARAIALERTPAPASSAVARLGPKARRLTPALGVAVGGLVAVLGVATWVRRPPPEPAPPPATVDAPQVAAPTPSPPPPEQPPLIRSGFAAVVDRVADELQVQPDGTAIESGALNQRLWEEEEKVGRPAALAAYCQLLEDSRPAVAHLADHRLAEVTGDLWGPATADDLFACLDERARTGKHASGEGPWRFLALWAELAARRGDTQRALSVLGSMPPGERRAYAYAWVWKAQPGRAPQAWREVLRAHDERSADALEAFGSHELSPQPALCALLADALAEGAPDRRPLVARRMAERCDSATADTLFKVLERDLAAAQPGAIAPWLDAINRLLQLHTSKERMQRAAEVLRSAPDSPGVQAALDHISAWLEDLSPPAQSKSPRVQVPAGEALLGCSRSRSRYCDASEPEERPVHVPAFAIDRTEVSVASYRACVEAGRCTPPETGSGCNWDRPLRSHHPANCVNWEQARVYCAWRGGRLPTATEWEKAARGTDGRLYPWGDERPTCERAVVHQAASHTTSLGGGCRRGSTWPVEAKPAGASPYGALNMVGNVAEWTADWADSGQRYRVIRGDSWRFFGLPPSRPLYRHRHPLKGCRLVSGGVFRTERLAPTVRCQSPLATP